MKSKYLLFAMLIAIITTSSCKKDNKNTTSSFPRILKENILYGQQTYSITYQYDDNFRVTKIVQLDGKIKTYNYVDSTVMVKTFNREGTAMISIETYTLNSKGLAKSLHGTGTYGSRTSTWSETYEYDGSGYLVKEVFSSTLETGHTAYYSILDGNMVAEAFLYDGQSDSTSYKFLPNTTNTIGNENTGISFLGKQNVNLFNWMNEKSSTHGTSPYICTYEFDNLNRVAKRIRTEEGVSTLTSTYIYAD
jgi:hypothetical protein